MVCGSISRFGEDFDGSLRDLIVEVRWLISSVSRIRHRLRCPAGANRLATAMVRPDRIDQQHQLITGTRMAHRC